MSVQQAQHEASVQQASADSLFKTILDDMKPYLIGTARQGSVAIADARKLVGLAVSCKGSAMAFDDKVRAELGVAAGGKSFVPLQGKILQRVTDHASTSNIQSSISTFKGGGRERVEGGVTKGGLVRVVRTGDDRPVFQKPAARTSSYGLQSLAEKKREADGITLPKRNRNTAFEAQVLPFTSPCEKKIAARRALAPRARNGSTPDARAHPSSTRADGRTRRQSAGD
jgi:hypothetical protein